MAVIPAFFGWSGKPQPTPATHGFLAVTPAAVTVRVSLAGYRFLPVSLRGFDAKRRRPDVPSFCYRSASRGLPSGSALTVATGNAHSV